MYRLIALLFAASALLGCSAPTADGTPLLVFERVTESRTDTMTIYPDGRTEMNHGGHIERLTFDAAIMDALRTALDGTIAEATVIGTTRHLLTLAAAAPIEIAVDEGTLGALLVSLLETHALH